MATLTAVTIAKNEEEHLARALESVRALADETIVVVDTASTDRTADIAREFTPHILRRAWDGFGPQKNAALDAATGDWVLFVDADEAVTPELAKEIRSVVQNSSVPTPYTLHPTPSVYFVRIVTEFLGKPLRHLWGTNPRLLRRSAARWDNRAVHEQVVRKDGTVVNIGDADIGRLQAPLWHPSHYATLQAYLRKRDRYTSRDAERMLATGEDRLGKPIEDPHGSLFATIRFLFERSAKQWIRMFVKKRGFLDGWQGLLWMWLSVQYEYIVAKKYLALKRARS